MRTWFITGASRGFGALIAAQALAAGDAVVATARDPSTIPEAVREHPNGLAVALDVTSESQARDAVRAAISRFGRIVAVGQNILTAEVAEDSRSRAEENKNKTAPRLRVKGCCRVSARLAIRVQLDQAECLS